jgi:hypothetical protein
MPATSASLGVQQGGADSKVLCLAGPCPIACLQSPAKLQQLAGSPNPKVQWGSVVSSSRLHKLPDTTATDASQSIFVPVGSGECGIWFHTRNSFTLS